MSNDNKTLADVQPGGMVRLGDALLPCPFCGESLTINGAGDGVHPRESDCILGQHVVVADHAPHAAAWNRRALSAQPSPGGQGGYVQGCDELRARTDGERAAYLEGLEEGKKIAARQPVEATDDLIREVFLRNGFTIKDGQSDLKPYVYAAARELLEVARQPVGEHGEGDEFLAGVCVALQCVTAQDSGVLWAEIVRAVGVDDLLQYATFIEPAEWDLAGFSTYASTELHRRKPRSKASKQAKRQPAQAVDLDAMRALLQRRIAQWRSHLPADPGAPGTREIETKGEHDYNNDVRIYREGIAVMQEVLSLTDSQAVVNGQPELPA